jgi:tetratricopeptide (TPR) repeat protein
MKPCCFYLEGPCFINRTLALAISFLLLLFNCVTLQAATVPNPVSSLPGRQVFKSIPLFPVEKRIESAVAFYKKYYRKAPAAVAMSGLDDLNGIAVKLDDKSLQCAVYWLRADYYSVNSLFNKLGISYYQDGINFARKNMLPVEIAISVHKMGMYYATFKHNATAYSYLLNANKMFKDIGFNKVPEITTYLNDLAVFYYNIGDFYNAKIQLTEALKYKTYTKRQEISMINSIGLIYRINREYDQAIDYFNKSLQLAKLSRDSAWIGIAQGNIGSAYLMQNNFKRALPYIRTDYTVSLKYAEVANAAIAMLRMVRIISGMF